MGGQLRQGRLERIGGDQRFMIYVHVTMPKAKRHVVLLKNLRRKDPLLVIVIVQELCCS